MDITFGPNRLIMLIIIYEEFIKIILKYSSQAFELAKAKLDVTELRNSVSQAGKMAADAEAASAALRERAEVAAAEKEALAARLQDVLGR